MKYIASILALDPGRTTGYAIGIVENGKPYIAYYQQEFDHKGLFQLLYQTSEACDWAVNIVCESFNFRRHKTGVDLYPCELIGVTNYFVQAYPMNALFMQNSSVQGDKAYFSDERLKDMKLYQKEYKHGRSAVKHLLHYLKFAHGASMMAEVESSELVTMKWAKEKLL